MLFILYQIAITFFVKTVVDTVTAVANKIFKILFAKRNLVRCYFFNI